MEHQLSFAEKISLVALGFFMLLCMQVLVAHPVHAAGVSIRSMPHQAKEEQVAEPADANDLFDIHPAAALADDVSIRPMPKKEPTRVVKRSTKPADSDDMADDSPTGDDDNLFKVRPEDAEKAISQALEEQKVAGNVKAVITSEHQKVLFSYHHPLAIGVKTLRFDDQLKKWSGNLFVFDGEQVVSAIPLSGRYDAMAQIPVLNTQVRRGDVISEKDVTMIDYPADKIRKGTLLKASEIVGQTPLRSVSEGRPVRTTELQQPFVVQKGKNVEMRFETPYMKITALGEAQEPGAVGEYIRVKNLDSNMSVHAKVLSEDAVEVRGTSPLPQPKVAALNTDAPAAPTSREEE